MLREWEVYSWGERGAPNCQSCGGLLVGDWVDAVREGPSVTELGKQLFCIEDHGRCLNNLLGLCKATDAALLQKTLRVHPCKLDRGRPWPQTFLQQDTNIRLKVGAVVWGFLFSLYPRTVRTMMATFCRQGGRQ